MALVLKDRVQETATPNTTVSFTCTGAVTGFQTFGTAIGNGNTTYYTGVDGSGNWECGLGTYTTAGNLVTRTTISASSNAGSAVTFSGAVTLFVSYPATKSVNLDASGNVSALGTVASGTWQGSTVGVAYGGTGVTTSTGANSVVLRDADENIIVNSVTQELAKTVSSATITTLTAASSHFQVLTGTTTQTYKLPDATLLPTGSTWVFDNDSTGSLTVTDNAGATLDIVAAGGYSTVFLEAKGTVGGEWGRFGMIPAEVNWGTNSLNLGGSTLITNGTWNGTTIAYNYGGTGLTSFAAANNALYSTSASALTAGTLPVLAGGTGVTTSTGTGNNVLSADPTFTGTVNTANLAYTGTLTGSTGILNIGSGQLYKDALGNVGIGNTPSGTYKLEVTGAIGGSTTINATTGYKVAGAATSGQYLRGNGTNFVSSAIQAADVPTLNQNTTGSSGSCTGNAATATTATNQSGGTVSATTGSFSGTTSFPSATGAFNIQNGTGDGASFTVYNTAIHSHWGIGFRDYQDLTTVKAYIDCRSGNIGTSGAFVGNVTGNVTGSSGSCTGNAATVTNGIYTTTIGSYAVKRSSNAGIINFNSYTSNSQVVGFDNSNTNGPSGVNFSTMLVMQERGDTSSQFVIDYNTGHAFSRGIYLTAPTYSPWRTILDDGNYNSYAPSLTGSGASGTWGINVTGSSASCTGNAATATSLVGSAFSAAANGYYKVASSGMIIQWGTMSGTGTHTTSYSFTFPLTFPTACQSIAATTQQGVSTGVSSVFLPITALSTTGATVQYGSINGVSYTYSYRWIAIGY